jgi:hypothetical protein
MDMSYAHQSAVDKTVDRWHTDSPDLDPLLLRSLYEFVRTHAEKVQEGDRGLNPLDVPCPELSGKACLERSTAQGGTAKAANDANVELADSIREATLKRIRALSPNVDLSRLPPLPFAQPLDAHIAYTFSKTRSGIIGKSGLAPALRPVPLTELGCKVRVASMHPWALAHVGRCFAARTLPVLKRLAVSRDMLRGKETTLKAASGAELYSADLSAASDWIPHRVGQIVVDALADGLGWTEDDEAAFAPLVGPMRSSRGITTRGLHMGLGSTWTVLSLINAWAASHTSRKSHRICGDDLLGLWWPHERDEYERRIEAIGLVINRSKAFYGLKGVFCERIAELRNIEGSHQATATAKTRSLPKISELIGARQVVERSGGLAVLRDQILMFIKGPLPRQARFAAQQFLRSEKIVGTRPGPAILGGGGGVSGKDTDPGLLAHALINGVHAPGWGAGAHKEFYARLTAHERKGPRHHDDVTVTDVAIPYLSKAVREERAQGKLIAPKLLPNQLARVSQKRSRVTELPSTLRDAIRHCPTLTSKGRRIAMMALQNGGLYRLARTRDLIDLKARNPKVYGRLANVVHQHVRERYLPLTDANALLESSHILPPVNQNGDERPWVWVK